MCFAGWPAAPLSLRHVAKEGAKFSPSTRQIATAAQAAEAVVMAPTAALNRLDYKPTPFLIDQVSLPLGSCWFPCHYWPESLPRRSSPADLPCMVQVWLDFNLGEESTTVTSKLNFVKNPACVEGASTDVVLNGV